VTVSHQRATAHHGTPNGHGGRGYTVQDLRDLVLSMSTERAVAAERERRAYRRGLAEGLDRGRSEGYLACMAEVKRTDAQLVAAFRRLPRQHYPRPRGHQDYPGGERGLAQTRASWAAWEAAQDWSRS
jgi:hypothetical protein